jgi:shikimate kinase
MRIFLIGYMGSGKSTIGKKLARQLQCDFIDLDTVIETLEEMKISELFDQVGETGFREKEQAALQQLMRKENVVIATGGGAPCFFYNMERMNANGITVYLKMEPGVLVNRLQNAKTERPLIANKSENELKAFVAESLTEREPFYAQAHLEFNAANVTSAKLEELAERISNYSK